MRTPKGMIRAFLTPEEMEQLETSMDDQINDLEQEIVNIKSEAAKEAIRSVVEQLKERRKAIQATKAPLPRKPGRPRKASNGEPKNRVEASTEATA